MLAIRPNCECCDRDLPAASTEALICTFECTFCRDCASKVFAGVCPNCAGELVRRPVRPASELVRFPASQHRVLVAHPGCSAMARVS
jgi:hypothetical protein